MSRFAIFESAALWPEIAGRLIAGQLRGEWWGSLPHLAGLERPTAAGWAAQPRDARPVSSTQGEDLLAGIFAFDGERLEVSAGGDPFATPSPSRRFAVALHRFDWLPTLMAAGDAGVREALRLTTAWQAGFGRWNAFAWSAEVIERRVFNLACAGRAMAAQGQSVESARLAQSLARQARHLARLARRAPRMADQLAAAAVAGVALGGAAGDQLKVRVLPRLVAALDAAVTADGGHRTRSPSAGMELLFDLIALEDGLSQRGESPPATMLAAMARLAGGLALLTMTDGRLVELQGGEVGTPPQIAAAHLTSAPDGRVEEHTAVAGFQRLDAPGLSVIADAAPAARGDWSLAACAQPLAITVTGGRDRLITASGWRPGGPPALRLADAASTLVIGGGQVGAPLAGLAGRALGARMVGGPDTISATRREDASGIWLDLAHDGWARSTRLGHERRLFLDKRANELRGEDRFVPRPGGQAASLPVALYFHLPCEVTARLARDRKSVLLHGPSGIGWWLRSDAAEVTIEPSLHQEGGRLRRAGMVVLRGRLRADRGGPHPLETGPGRTGCGQPAATD